MTGAAAAAVAVLAMCGCQTTARHSAELGKRAKHVKLESQGVSVTKASPDVEVLRSTVVHSGAGTAVVVSLRNTSRRTLVDAPIAIAVRDEKGAVIFKNDQPGADPSLRRVSLLVPGEEVLWIDDQVQASGTPASASALVGEGEPAPGSPPRMKVSAVKVSDEGEEAGAAGAVTNASKIDQRDLVVYAVARKRGHIVAAGRAILPEVSPGAKVAFQMFFVGDPRGAEIQASAPPTSF